MTVHENIGFGLRVRGLSKDEINRRVKEASQILGIEKFLDRKTGRIERRPAPSAWRWAGPSRASRKSFCWTSRCRTWMPKLRTQMRADLKLLFNRLGGTVVYVTHDQLEAMTLSDRVVVMKDGIIQQVGHPLKLYDHPENMFVAGFMGNPTMNFINCEAGCEIGKLVLRSQQVIWPLDLPAKTTDGTQVGGNLILGIRPEDMIVGLPGEIDPAKSIPCAIEVIESMGSQNIIYVNVEGTRLVITMETDFNGRSGGHRLSLDQFCKSSSVRSFYRKEDPIGVMACERSFLLASTLGQPGSRHRFLTSRGRALEKPTTSMA